jgi:RHS repeat-associated protein
MKTCALRRLAICSFIALGMLPRSGHSQGSSNPEPDVDPTGNAGAFKTAVETGGGYNPHNGNATRSITDLHVPGAPGVYGLDFTRHWNSTDESLFPGFLEPRAFGAGGWTHSWNWTASTDIETLYCDAGEGNPCWGGYYVTYIHFIKIEYADGRSGRFFFSRTNLTPPSVDPDPQTPEPYPSVLSGSFSVDDHLMGMAEDGSHFWLHLADGGSVYFERFASGYRGTKVVDPHGLATILSYESDENGDRLSRVAGPDGRSIFITWGSFGGTTPTVIRKVGWGLTPSLLLQSVEYCYTAYSLASFVWYALTTATYVDDFNSGQQVKATYTYVPWNNYLQAPTDIMPTGRGPLLTTADDPRFDGAMTRIQYVFRGGPGGEAPCLHTNPAPAPGNIGPSVHMAPFPVEKELSPDGQVVSQLWIPCNGTAQTGMRVEYRGAGGSRIFQYGKAGGLEPGAWFEEIPNGPDIWHPPEAYPGPGTHGYNAGIEITRLTDFADNPNSATTPRDFHHNRMVKPYRSFDARGTLTEFTFQRGNDYPGMANNGRIKETWHRDADNSKHTFNWDVPTPGTEDRDTMHLPNPYDHWLYSQTDERNKTTTYTRDRLRRVTQISYYDGPAQGSPMASESFTYNDFNQITTHTLASGAVQYYDYLGSFLWREWNTVDTVAEAVIYTPDTFGRVSTAQNARARAAGKAYSAWMEYNARHQVTKVRYPSTGGSSDPTVIYEYDKYGNCTAITNELGYRSVYTYDAYRRCTSYTEPVNSPACAGSAAVGTRTWNWTYERVATDGTVRDALTHTSNKWRTQIEPAYDTASHRRATVRDYDYNDQMNYEFVGAIVPAGGGQWNFDHGALHQYEYDANGNKKKYTDPRARITTYDYNKRDWLIKTTEPLNRITETTYDLTGNKTFVKLPDLNTQKWENYDPFGQAWKFTDERHNVTDLTYQWGPMKKLDTVRTHRTKDNESPETQLTNFDYDGLGRLEKTLFPDGSFEFSTYLLGQLKTWKTRRNQLKTITSYDARGRELSHTWSDNTPGVTRSWDDANRLLTLANRFSAIDYGYDQAGQVLTEGSAVTGNVGEAQTPRKQVSYCRFPSGEVSAVTYPNGLIVQRAYTVRGQLDGVGWSGSGGSAGSVSYVYWPDGRVNYQAGQNGVATLFDYNDRGFIKSILHQSGAGNLSKRTYYRDDRDRIHAWQKDVNPGVNPMENGRGDRYEYDAEGQLWLASYEANDPNGSASNPARNDIFTYDEMGNRKGTNNYVASRGWMDFTRRDNGLNQYLMWSPFSAIYYDDSWGSPPNPSPSPPWVFPGNGVTMSDGWITASYNALNQPVAMGNPTYGSNFLWFAHDPLGRCVKRWMGNVNGEPVGSNPATYLYYDGWNLVQEGNTPNAPTRLYVHGGRVDEIVAQITPANNWLRYFHYDARGHCTLQTDASGNIMEQYEYDAFGLPYIYDAAGNPTTMNGQPYSPWGNRFLFTGREWLSELRIYDYRARQYQPELGRFLQPDPRQFEAGDFNLYRYCHNDPVNKSDPTGLDPIVVSPAENALALQGDTQNLAAMNANTWLFGLVSFEYSSTVFRDSQGNLTLSAPRTDYHARDVRPPADPSKTSRVETHVHTFTARDDTTNSYLSAPDVQRGNQTGRTQQVISPNGVRDRYRPSDNAEERKRGEGGIIERLRKDGEWHRLPGANTDLRHPGAARNGY